MKPGIYDMRFTADGTVVHSDLTIRGVLAENDDARLNVRGEITRNGPRVIGALTIEVDPALLRNKRIKRVFALSMTGTGSETEFSLWGLGPLGLIVEIVGTWRQPSLALV